MNDDLNKQRKAHHEERNRLVRVKHMLFVHATEAAVLLQESPELSGDSVRKVWVPRSRIINPSRPIIGCYPLCSFEFDCTKALAEEKELFYE